MPPSSLAELQARMSAWLRAPLGTAPDVALLALVAHDRPGLRERLDTYRHSVHQTQAAALAAVYPVVAQLLGDSLFAALCADYLMAPGSRSGDLHRLGAGFAMTIQAEPACAAHAYVADVAELEWRIHRCGFAGGVPSGALLDPSTVSAQDIPRLCLRTAPSLALLASDWPVGEIWQAHQAGAAGHPAATRGAGTAASLERRLASIDLQSGPEWLALLSVPTGVQLGALPRADFRVLEASQRGATLAEALDCAGEDAIALDQRLPVWLGQGWVLGLGLAPQS